VAAIPVSAFYVETPPRHYVRFAFCKQPAVLEAALERLARWTAAKALTVSA
jgi:aspartate/methionine/tyrosine aminotransferase